MKYLPGDILGCASSNTLHIVGIDKTSYHIKLICGITGRCTLEDRNYSAVALDRVREWKIISRNKLAQVLA